jgi:hypothetical protein
MEEEADSYMSPPCTLHATQHGSRDERLQSIVLGDGSAEVVMERCTVNHPEISQAFKVPQ